MVEDTGIVNAIDSFVASLEEEQANGKLIEDNSNNKEPEMSDDNRLMGLNNIATIIKKSVEMICLGEKVKVNLNDLVENIKTRVCSLKPELEIKIDKLPTIIGDPMKLGQVFENLMMNIVKHAEASKLEIKFEKDRDELRIIIKDDGKGISNEKKMEIIESWSTKRYSSFGLLIVVKIIQAHNGHITLESEEGKGTEITIHFSNI